MADSDNENQYRYGAYDYRTQNEDDQIYREEQRRRDEEDARQREIEAERERQHQEQEAFARQQDSQRQNTQRQQQASQKSKMAHQAKDQTVKQTDFDDFLDVVITICGGIIGFFIAEKQGFATDLEPFKFFGIIAAGAAITYALREVFRFLIKLVILIASIILFFAYVWPEIEVFLDQV